MSSAEFLPSYPLSDLAPADYNPRKLGEDKFVLLQESLRKFGVIKPVIINGGNGILTAGHQRTRAMKAIGITHCPAIRLQGISRTDEIRFNLYHNSIETNKSEVTLSFEESELEPETYTFIVVSEIVILLRPYGDRCHVAGRAHFSKCRCVHSRPEEPEVWGRSA